MAERIRNTKARAARIRPSYFRRLFAIRQWRRFLSAGLAVAGLIWLAWYAFARSATPYSAGPIRSAHSAFSQNCATCHASTALFSHKTSNEACSACHDGPVHQAQQTFTPACATCHREHTGVMDLTRTSDQWCSQCHSNLQTRSGLVKVSANITSFEPGHHPEFAALRGASDPRTIKFNHKLHMKKDLRFQSASGVNFVQLECSDCHRPTSANNSWPYGRQVSSTVAAPEPKPHARQSDRPYMAPVNYDEHCAGCHPLTYDSRLDAVPHHQKFEELEKLITQSYTAYIAAHPEALHDMTYYEQIARRSPAVMPSTPSEWVAQQTSAAERFLWNARCGKCHSLSFPAGAKFPVQAAPNVTHVWLPKANFDHEAHQLLECESCHGRARTAENSFEVLIPGVETCERCHRPNDTKAAAGGCYECHVYHDWTKERPVKGKYGIRTLLSKATVQ